MIESPPTQQTGTRNLSAGFSFHQWMLELDSLLDRIERARSHYQRLGIERSASREDVLTAYTQSLEQLFPAYQIGSSLPPEMRQRLDQAFEKVTQSFATLADFNRRKEADRQPVFDKESSPAESQARAVSEPENSEPLEVRNTIAQQEVFSVTKPDGRERRRCERFRMRLPIRVTGHGQAEGKWNEMSETIDVSRTGTMFQLKHRVQHNTILHLVVPLPLKLRAHGFTETSYSVYAVIRRVIPLPDGKYSVGVEFIGEHPPPGYLDKPWAVCRLKQWLGINRRRHPRYEIIESVMIEFLSADRQAISREPGVTENISRGGARVKVRAVPKEFDLVRIIARKGQFESVAVLANRFQNAEGTAVICLQFIEKEWPLENLT